jgi:outer membrane protein assembly factor BamE (lipoprotein component of BamABCDE complex)
MSTRTSPHQRPSTRGEQPVRRRPARARALAFVLAAAALGGCVTQDAKTGEYIPRGNQRYEFSKVEEAAENLRDGMSKAQVLMLLGSPAEKDDDGDTWIYLPERYAILIPARALQLEFKDGVLASHGYRPIVLGAKL